MTSITASYHSTASNTTRKSVTFDTASFSSEHENSGHSSISIGNFNAEIARQEDAIKIELSRVSKPCNLLLCMIHGLLCLNWYIIGSQWLMLKDKVPEIECNIEELQEANWTFLEKRSITMPKSNIYEPGCIYYDYDYIYLSILSYEDARVYVTTIEKPGIRFCKKYTINKDVLKEVSFVKEFDLICFKKPFQRGNFYMAIGQVFLAFPSGVLADMYGRKPVHIFCSVLASISSVVVPVSLNFGMFALSRSIQGGCIASISIMLHLTYTEICRRKYRAETTMAAFLWFLIASGQNIGINGIVESWRLRRLILGLVLLIDTISVVMFVPESPRYLLVKRQFSKAWDVLYEFGSTENRPDNVQNYEATNINFKYQLKIFTKQYLLHRVIIVLILNSAGVYYFYVFRNMSMKVMVLNETLKFQIAVVAVFLLISTLLLIPTYTVKTVICIYFFLLALCFIGRIITADGGVIMDMTSLAGIMLSNIIFILTFSFMIDIFPTTHRGTILGFSLSTHFLIATLVDVFYEELRLEEESNYLNALYCTMCLLCALITIISPDTDAEIPDSKHDLFQSLSLESSNQSTDSSD